MYIGYRSLIFAGILLVINLYFWIFRKEDLKKWPQGMKWLLYLTWILGILSLISAFVPMPTPK
jgi:hypothetical protein